jgi:CDP-2,3-bis-(O-geranylgeranyl)-sn-glycerol synthase
MIGDMQIAVWFLLPAALANAAPIFSAKIPYWKKWNTPLDFGATHHDEPIMGSNKTWRGLVTGMLVATLTLCAQVLAYNHYGWAQDIAGTVPYATLPILLLGPLFGLGALGGDALESYFKRRRGISSGKQWFPFDQIDYIIGAIVVSLPFVQLSVMTYAWMVVIWFLLHLLASYIGWLLGLKKQPI